jgi:hypothetical protein
MNDPVMDDGSRLMKYGLELGGIDKLKAEMFERNSISPEQVFAEPFHKNAWRLVGDELKRQRRGIPERSDTQHDLDICIVTANLVEGGTTPWDALVLQAECCEIQWGKTRPNAQRLLREACYKVLNEEFLGRKVG